jgi:hypothetical protein
MLGSCLCIYKHLFVFLQMAYQVIDAELRRCEAELHAYLGAGPSQTKSLPIKFVDGRSVRTAVLYMDSSGSVWIEVSDLTPAKFYNPSTVAGSGEGYSSTQVPWIHVFDRDAFRRDCLNEGILEARIPDLCFVRAFAFRHNGSTMEFNIETNESIGTQGGGYTTTKKLRRVRFTAP